MTVQEEVRQKIGHDAVLARLRRKIDSGKGTYLDTFAYSDRAGKLLGGIFSQRLPDIPPEEREALCVELLRDRYTDINSLCDTVQRALDEAQGIHIAPQHAPFDEERASQIGSATADPTVPEETQQRRARSAPETATKAMHDDRMKAEAKFRSRAGLKCHISRVSAPGCCKWCSEMAGRYAYGEEPDDIYRRHDNCGCSVTFENGRQRQDVWSKREWEAPEPGAGAGDPVVFTSKQAKEIEAKHQPTVLTPSVKSGTIPLGAIFTRAVQPNRRIGTDGQQVIDKPTFNKLMRKFLRHGGVIRDDEEAVRHLQDRPNPAYAAYLPGFNVILLTPEPTISDILEETYHAEQDRLHMFGEQVTTEVLLRREIDAQHYLLSMTEKYKIPLAEVEVTRENLKKYERDLEELLRLEGGEQND